MASFTEIAKYSLEASLAKTDIGGSLKQQDNGCSVECSGSNGSKMIVVGVFDGHCAKRGEKFSTICTERLISCVSSFGFKDHFDENPESVGREICARISTSCLEFNIQYLEEQSLAYTIENGLIKSEHILKLQGGSTGTILFITDLGVIHCFNVGDSDAWFIGTDTCESLCSDHSPSSRDEYDRIMEINPECKFEYHYQVSCGSLRNPEGDHVFPVRENFNGYYIKNVSGDMASVLTVPSPFGNSVIAMTRSFGDEPLRHGGLISEPSYKRVQVKDKGIVKIASDGFWDNIRNVDIASDTAIQLNTHGYNAEVIAEHWLSCTRVKAKQNFGNSRDNMWGYVIAY